MKYYVRINYKDQTMDIVELVGYPTIKELDTILKQSKVDYIEIMIDKRT